MLRRGFLRRSAVRCFKWDGGEKGNRMPDVVAAGTGATPAAFYLGLCRLRGILSLPAPPRLCCRRAILLCSNDGAASIPKFGPEIKNRCTKEGLNREKLASIPKFGPEIKNRCTQEGLNREILASIPKSGLEIKNRCRPGLRRRNHFPLRQRRLVSDAERRCSAA